jgi:hypothetical protein
MRAGPSSLRRGTHTGPPSAVTQHAVEMTAGGQSSGDNGGAEAKASVLPSGVLNDQVIRDRGLSTKTQHVISYALSRIKPLYHYQEQTASFIIV